MPSKECNDTATKQNYNGIFWRAHGAISVNKDSEGKESDDHSFESQPGSIRRGYVEKAT